MAGGTAPTIQPGGYRGEQRDHREGQLGERADDDAVCVDYSGVLRATIPCHIVGSGDVGRGHATRRQQVFWLSSTCQNNLNTFLALFTHDLVHRLHREHVPALLP